MFIRKGGAWETMSVPSFDFDTLDAASILIGQRTAREFDEGNPYVNSTLPGGQRFQGVRPPGTKAGRILWAIRRPPSVARIEDDDFPTLFADTNRGTRDGSVEGPIFKRSTARAIGASFFRQCDLRVCQLPFAARPAAAKATLPAE